MTIRGTLFARESRTVFRPPWLSVSRAREGGASIERQTGSSCGELANGRYSRSCFVP
jgi:hypothetical protein